MAKHSSHVLEMARKGAEHRLDELKAEIASLIKAFPHLAVRQGRRLARGSAESGQCREGDLEDGGRPQEAVEDVGGGPQGGQRADEEILGRETGREKRLDLDLGWSPAGTDPHDQGRGSVRSRKPRLYATDGSNYRQIPIGLVVPRDADDVVAAVAACRKFGAPVLSRGAGTSLAGQCCNVAVVLDFTKYMNHILELDPGSEVRARPAGRRARHAAQSRRSSTSSPSDRIRRRTAAARSAA